MLSPFEMAQLGKERQQEFIKAAELSRRVNAEDISYEDIPAQQKTPFFQLSNPFASFGKQRKLRRASQS